MSIIPAIRMRRIGDLTDLERDSTVEAVPEKHFDSMPEETIREADQTIKGTQVMDMKLTSEQVDNLHAALIQAEKTAAAVEFTTQITTKAVNAYDQIIGIQV